MSLELFNPANHGAGPILQAMTYTDPKPFERLPINLTTEEIRAMVMELLG